MKLTLGRGMMTDRADDMKAELREGDGPLEQAPPPKPILSARLSSSPTNVAPATPTLSGSCSFVWCLPDVRVPTDPRLPLLLSYHFLAARLSPTGVGMKGLRRHDERDARGILSMANFGGAESGSRPQSPLETTKKLLHGLVGVAQGVGGDEAGVGFPWALLESVSSPAVGAGNPADCEQRNSAGCEPRGPAGSSRAASPLLAKLKPTGPPKTLCRDLPKRQPRSTKVLETPDALRMKLAIESEVISEHVQGSGDGEGEGEYEGEGSGEGEGEGDCKASHRHSAPASMIYNVNLMNCSPWRGAVGGAAGCDHVHIAEEVGRGGRLGGEAERRHSAPSDIRQPTSLSAGLHYHHDDNRDWNAVLRASCRTSDDAGEAQGHDLR